MSDKFNLLKNVRVSVASFVVNIVLVFISYRLVIAYDGIESLGLWSLLMAWASLVRVGDVGMGGAILRFVSIKNQKDEGNDIRVLIDTGVVMNIIVFGVLTLSGYFILNMYLGSVVDNDVFIKAESLLPIIFSGIFLSTMFTVLVSSLQGLHLGYIGAYLTVVGNILQIVCVSFLVPDLGVLGLVWSQLIQYSVATVLAWYLVKQSIGVSGFFSIKFSFNVLREMLGYSLKAQIANVSNGAFEPISKILMSQFGGLQIQGLYELAYKTVSLTRNSIVSGVYASLPMLTNLINNNIKEAQRLYVKVKKNVIKATAIMMVIVVVFSPVISLIWVGKFSVEYWELVIYLSLGFLFNTIGATAYNLGLATWVMKNNIISALLTLLVLLFLSYMLGYFFESRGVGLAVVLSLGFGGLLIKQLNEKLLFKKSNSLSG